MFVFLICFHRLLHSDSFWLPHGDSTEFPVKLYRASIRSYLQTLSADSTGEYRVRQGMDIHVYGHRLLHVSHYSPADSLRYRTVVSCILCHYVKWNHPAKHARPKGEKCLRQYFEQKPLYHALQILYTVILIESSNSHGNSLVRRKNPSLQFITKVKIIP